MRLRMNGRRANSGSSAGYRTVSSKIAADERAAVAQMCRCWRVVRHFPTGHLALNASANHADNVCTQRPRRTAAQVRDVDVVKVACRLPLPHLEACVVEC